jgi:hypothetical protein
VGGRIHHACTQGSDALCFCNTVLLAVCELAKALTNVYIAEKPRAVKTLLYFFYCQDNCTGASRANHRYQQNARRHRPLTTLVNLVPINLMHCDYSVVSDDSAMWG